MKLEGVRGADQRTSAPDPGFLGAGKGRTNSSFTTGEPFVDLDAGLQLACKKAEVERVTVAYSATRSFAVHSCPGVHSKNLKAG